MTEDDRAARLRAMMLYASDFRSTLQKVGGSALSDDPLLSATELHSLYSPSEVVAGLSAAQDAGFGVAEGVAAFIFISAAAHAETMKRSLLGRLAMKRPPKPGTAAHGHLAMFHYASRILLKGMEPDTAQTRHFADLYAEELRKAT